MYTAANKDDVTMKTAQNAQTIRENANEAKHDLKEAANQAGRKVRNMYNAAYDEAVQVKDTVTSQIRTNPVQSSLIALGVGFVLGALFRR